MHLIERGKGDLESQHSPIGPFKPSKYRYWTTSKLAWFSFLGGDLGQVIRKAKSNQITIAGPLIEIWLFMLCEALKYIHANKIIHRDVKPANIFLGKLKNIKLGKHSVISTTAVIKQDILIFFRFWFWKQSKINSYNHSNGN